MSPTATHPLYTEQSALTWYEFIRDRLEDDLRAAYPLQDDGPAATYREQYGRAQEAHQRFLTERDGGGDYEIEQAWWGLKNIADGWRQHPDLPEPISDGTLPCPVTSPETGHPCTKMINPGWTPSEGHGGGHWFQDPKFTELRA
ncbi:hypothetical protein ABT117_16885 [Streptomyces sp. NPDC002262]|uniref:hypothetical protein n=1 Tax=Streptomyces sp. NPDC002262 TaxID=3154414 RepID=UPI003324B46C